MGLRVGVLLLECIVYIYHLLIFGFLAPRPRHELRGYVEGIVEQVVVPPFVPQTGVTIHTTDSEAQAAASGAAGNSALVKCVGVILMGPPLPSIDQDDIERIVNTLPKVGELNGFKMFPLDFEKVCL